MSVVIGVMASFSTSLLGMGQRDLLLPLLTILAAVTSIVFTDMFRWIHLHHVLANVAMVLAAIFSLNDFLGSNSHEQLQAIARLLTYVQIVLLFQQKSVRIYGQLMMFSLLQVVVAALLNASLEFGLLLVVYMILAVSGIALFFVFREVERLGTVTPNRRRLIRWGAEPVDGSLTAAGHPAPTFEMVDSPAVLRGGVLGRRVVFPWLGLVAVMLVFAVVFFYTTPRTGGSNWEGRGGLRSVVGFSPEVSFEEMGRLLSSQALVMRVSFADAKSGAHYTLLGEPYFRGTALTKYLTADGYGQWRQEVESVETGGLALQASPETRELVRQDVLLEPTGSPQLFSMFPVYALGTTPESLRLGPRTSRLFRAGYSRRELRTEFRYRVATTALHFGTQYPVAPEPNRLATLQARLQMERMKMRLRFLDSREQFPQLIALASQIVNDRAPQGNVYEKAQALEAHFREVGRYTYCIDFHEINSWRNFELDPLEDFVSNHRQGHCEYFASALTLMLRSQGIPARMVIGYKGGEFNYIGNYFSVRQADAHAWVEAYLKPEEIPAGAMCPEERHAGGGWLRLDPTPGTELVGPLEEHDLFDRVTKSFDYARWLWNDYVLRLSRGQQDSILRPLALDRPLPLADLARADAWRELVHRISRAGVTDASRIALNWRHAVGVLITCLIACGLYKLVPYVWPFLARAVPPRRSARPGVRRRSVAFYQRLESILAMVGLQRGPGQTQREFARLAAQRLGGTADDASAVAILETVVQAFYQVRFGHAMFDAQQEADIHAQLEQLLRLLSARTSSGAQITGNGPS
ncbi:MAG: transglutaminase TgpA family protein [Pirellulaceae bacterium]